MRNIGKRENDKIGTILLSYIKNNLKEYAIVIIIFLIGIIFGVIFINNATRSTNGRNIILYPRVC